MSLFDKFDPLKAVQDELNTWKTQPFGTVIDHLYSATEACINGRRTILAGTNNYLGLTFHDRCINAGLSSIRKQGTGTTGSRMANGTYADHLSLESELAAFYGLPHAMVFSTGYAANLGMIASLAGPDDTILLDSHAHASIYDGCKLSSAAVLHFRHNDAADLEKRLGRLQDRAQNALVITEGIYSMLGDRACLADIVAVKNRYGAFLLVDEAHSLGVLGQSGRGLAQECNLEADIDFITGTFSKSLAGIGGFCVSRHAVLKLVRFSSRPYIFTASPSPATIATTREALRIIASTPQLRTRLWENAEKLYRGLTSMGFTLGPEVSPVIAVRAGYKDQALKMWQKLLDRGVYVNPVLPPATPDNQCLLRCSVSAAHTSAQLDVILSAFSNLQSISTQIPAGSASEAIR